MKKIHCLLACFLSASSLTNISAQVSSAVRTKAVIPAKASKSPKKIIIKYGIASFYAKKFIGRTTSNGSIYSADKLTAACNVLPLGTWVKVTNLKNARTVIVQINDHLHHKNKRLVDLSRLAAKKLRYINSGITRVKVEVLGDQKNSNYLFD
jgi:rare lipoprotein A